MKYFEVPHILTRKKIIGYGASQALLATQAGCELQLNYVVDDNPQMQGQHINGIPIYSPKRLLDEDKSQTFVILFAYLSKNIMDISARLDGMGYEYWNDYIDCSVFHYESVTKKLENILHITPNYETFFKTRMLSLYTGIQNNSFVAGTWLFLEVLANICTNVDGDIAECGVFNGANAFIASLVLPELASQKYHLFDSFEGFPELSPHDPVGRRNDFQDINFTTIRNKFSNFTNIEIHKGFFSNTLSEVASQNFCMAYIDCDLYASTMSCCDFFYNRVVPGGVLLFHDYWVPESGLLGWGDSTFPGVSKAVNEFFEDKVEEIVTFPETTHGLVIKR